jgi:hypothetical protein
MWKAQLDKVTNRAYKAFCTCIGTFRKMQELKLKMLH